MNKGAKIFENHLNPIMLVFIAFSEYSCMSTLVPGFQSFFVFCISLYLPNKPPAPQGLTKPEWSRWPENSCQNKYNSFNYRLHLEFLLIDIMSIHDTFGNDLENEHLFYTNNILSAENI